MLGWILPKLVQSGFVGAGITTQKNRCIANVHIEGQVFDLLARLVGGFYCGDMDFAFLLELAGGHNLGDELEIGRADDNISAAGQFFDGNVEDNALVEGTEDAAVSFHGAM